MLLLLLLLLLLLDPAIEPRHQREL